MSDPLRDQMFAAFCWHRSATNRVFPANVQRLLEREADAAEKARQRKAAARASRAEYAGTLRRKLRTVPGDIALRRWLQASASPAVFQLAWQATQEVLAQTLQPHAPDHPVIALATGKPDGRVTVATGLDLLLSGPRPPIA